MSSKTQVSRRQFLKLLAAGGCGALVHRTLLPAEQLLAYAAPADRNKVLIVLNLAGGASYNLTPLYSGHYRDRNPTISYGPQDSLALNSEQGLHPNFNALSELYSAGELALVNMVGYPDPDRSHDGSTSIWFRGSRGSGFLGGWGARLTCQMPSVFGGVALSGSNELIRGECNPPRAYSDLNRLGETRFKNSATLSEWFRITRANVMADADPIGGPNAELVRSAILNNDQNNIVLQEQLKSPLPLPDLFPNTGLGRQCRDAARLLAAPSLQTRFVFMQTGGFDTHSNEKSRLAGLVAGLDAALSALVQNAKALGRWNDIVVVTMSEFCRTYENGSAGTDHGHAGPLLVLGGQVRGGLKAPPPSAAEISARNYLRDYHVDFRQIYKDVISYMGYDPAAVFPETVSFSQLDLF